MNRYRSDQAATLTNLACYAEELRIIRNGNRLIGLLVVGCIYHRSNQRILVSISDDLCSRSPGAGQLLQESTNCRTRAARSSTASVSLS